MGRRANGMLDSQLKGVDRVTPFSVAIRYVVVLLW